MRVSIANKRIRCDQTRSTSILKRDPTVCVCPPTVYSFIAFRHIELEVKEVRKALKMRIQMQPAAKSSNPLSAWITSIKNELLHISSIIPPPHRERFLFQRSVCVLLKQGGGILVNVQCVLGKSYSASVGCVFAVFSLP